MSDIVIKSENIGKKYIIGHQAERDGYTAMRDVLAQNARTLWNKTKDLAMGKSIIQGDTIEEVWALRDVSFEIRRGEAVGIIGRNGAGKSTLLKILSRITEPSTGRVTIKGRVASLLEVGTGFHPELTGRENIYLNGAILGMTREEIKRKFDEIVAFAEVEKYLDTPVKRYSSGMYVRLAFAVAAHLEPEILVVDEVLAVGDAQFQKKCLGKMGDVAKGGRTVLFVSHNMAAVRALCERGFVLEHGKVSFQGSAQDAISSYVVKQNSKVAADVDTSCHSSRLTKYVPIIRRVTLCSVDNLPRSTFGLGEPIMFKVVLESTPPLSHVIVGLHVYNFMSQRVVTFHTRDQLIGTLNVNGRVNLSCLWGECNLMPGQYTLVVGLASASGQEDRIEPALSFTVIEANFYGTGRIPPGTDGYFLPRCQWEIQNNR
jgi:lipopolysaccharide transport system ATP-binding protein